MKEEIKAEEVRIGISANVGGVDIGVSYSVMQLWLAGKVKLYAIPLTEEWLLKLGFEETYKSKYRTRYDLIENCKFGFDIAHHGDYAEGFRYIGENFSHIKYVHQLQNLYFALTGEELEIKELSSSA